MQRYIHDTFQSWQSLPASADVPLIAESTERNCLW